MVVIVQFLAADQDAPRHDVAARILGLEVAVTPEMADAVDDAGGEHRDPHHLHCPDRQADETEQREIDNHHEGNATHRMRRIHIALHPIVRRALAEFLQRLGVLRLEFVEIGTLPHDLVDAEYLRAMRIFGGFAACMVLAMNRRPFLGFHAGSDPQPETEKMADDGMQIQRAMRRMPVQIDRDRRDGDVGQGEGDGDIAPPGKYK